MALPFIRSSLARAGRPAQLRVGPTPNHTRLASTESRDQEGTPRWLLVSIALGIPLSIYLWRRGDSSASSTSNSSRDSPEHDEPRAMGSPSGPSSMSFKQEGVSNADTMNPFVNEPDKSKKGEGETETAKVKGTVKTTRPQV